MSLIVVAIGGNALIRGGRLADAREQFENARRAAEELASLVRAGHRLVVVHGNGPQVGAALLRSELAAGRAYRLPVDCCVAATQGEIGYVIQHALDLALGNGGPSVVSLITQVVVDPDDPAYARPTKPIGPAYERADAERLRDTLGWTLAEQAGRGWRRVVASPTPHRILELEAVRACLDSGAVVIAGGGGGIPVFESRELGPRVEAVIDKDATSALLATRLGADRLAIATDQPCVYADFGTPAQRPLQSLTVPEAERLLGAGVFPDGSMGPKVRAAKDFAAGTGRHAVIGQLDALNEMVAGRAGTRVVPGP